MIAGRHGLGGAAPGNAAAGPSAARALRSASRSILRNTSSPIRSSSRSPSKARRALFELREEDRIGDEVLREMLREADLKARAAEGPAAVLPGAAPPNP